MTDDFLKVTNEDAYEVRVGYYGGAAVPRAETGLFGIDVSRPSWKGVFTAEDMNPADYTGWAFRVKWVIDAGNVKLNRKKASVQDYEGWVFRAKHEKTATDIVITMEGERDGEVRTASSAHTISAFDPTIVEYIYEQLKEDIVLAIIPDKRWHDAGEAMAK